MRKTFLIPLALLVVTFASWYACEKVDPEHLAGETSKIGFKAISVDSLGNREAMVSYSLENLDQNEVQSLGICYNTSGEPTQKDNTVSLAINSSSTGTINGLSPDTEYYVRLYAEISGKTVYSEGEISFLALLKGRVTDSRDGQTYEWVRIGDQVWMAKNLNYDQESYGNDWCYDNDQSNCDTYGRLYDWAAVMQGESSSDSNPSGVQGICPEGWHVPSDDEWEKLAEYISNDNGGYTRDEYGWSHVGGHLKATSGWGSEDNGTDDYGFSGLPGGYYRGNENDGFEFIGLNGYWWSASESSTWGAWYRGLYSNDGFDRSRYGKVGGFSVRCLRD